jgi:hypothetical protein
MSTSKVANTDDGSFRTIANFAIRFRSLKNMPSGWTITPCTPSRIDENELAARLGVLSARVTAGQP